MMHNRHFTGKGSGLRLYRSYSFVDKDPVIDKIRTLVQDEHLKEKEVGMLSGVRDSTMKNWFHGTTRRPQFASIAAVAAALGYDFEFKKKRDLNYEKELKKAADELLERRQAAERAERRRKADNDKNRAERAKRAKRVLQKA
jgi:transcriptional regulator with XRE-family HTH domain